MGINYRHITQGLFCLAFCVFLAACGAKKEAVRGFKWEASNERDKLDDKQKQDDKDEREIRVWSFDEDKVKPGDSLKVDAPVDSLTGDTIFEELEERDYRRIAIMMPFMYDSMRRYQRGTYRYIDDEGEEVINISDDTESNAKSGKPMLAREAKRALEFYEGALIALDSLKAAGLNAKVHVFDTKNDVYWVNRMLEQEIMTEMDVIIGPMSKDCGRAVAQFCKDMGVFNINPFSPSKSIAQQNNYHVKVNPSLAAHIEATFQYLAKNYAGNPVTLFYQAKHSEIAMEEQFMRLERLHNAVNPDKRVPITSVSVPRDEETRFDFTLTDHLYEDQTNIVIISSHDISMVHDLMRQLSAAVDEGYEVILFGMPTWRNSKNLRLDYFDKLRLHLTNAYRLNVVHPDNVAFSAGVEERFAMQPSHYTYTGYDVMRYVGRGLIGQKDEQIRFRQYIEKQPYKGLEYDFMFKQTRAEANSELARGKFDFYENKDVRMLQFVDFEWRMAQKLTRKPIKD